MWNRYPANDGAVSDSRQTHDLSKFKSQFGEIVDRVGFEDGSYLYALKDGEPESFEARSLPVSDLELPYARYRLATEWPDGIRGWLRRVIRCGARLRTARRVHPGTVLRRTALASDR